MIPAYTDEAFCKLMKYCMGQCERHERPFVTYDKAVAGLYAPELMRRFTELTELPEGMTDEDVERRGDAISETLDAACAAAADWESRFKSMPSWVHMTTKLSEILDRLVETTREMRGKTRVKNLVPTSEAFSEALDNVRAALGQNSTHYLIIADDVRDLVQAIELDDGGAKAKKVLARIREDGK